MPVAPKLATAEREAKRKQSEKAQDQTGFVFKALDPPKGMFEGVKVHTCNTYLHCHRFHLSVSSPAPPHLGWVSLVRVSPSPPRLPQGLPEKRAIPVTAPQSPAFELKKRRLAAEHDTDSGGTDSDDGLSEVCRCSKIVKHTCVCTC